MTLFSIKHLGLLSNFIVLIEVLIGYFRKIILGNLRVLQTERHIGSICICLDVWEWDKAQHIAKWEHSLKYCGFSHLSLWEDAVKSRVCIWF